MVCKIVPVLTRPLYACSAAQFHTSPPCLHKQAGCTDETAVMQAFVQGSVCIASWDVYCRLWMYIVLMDWVLTLGHSAPITPVHHVCAYVRTGRRQQAR